MYVVMQMFYKRLKDSHLRYLFFVDTLDHIMINIFTLNIPILSNVSSDLQNNKETSIPMLVVKLIQMMQGHS